MACDCCREGAMHYSAVSVNQYTPPGNQPPVTQMSEGPSCCPHHDGHHVHTHSSAHHSQQHAHGSAHHSQQHAHGSAHHSQQHHAMAVSPYPAGHCPHQHSHGDTTTTTTDDCYLCNSRGHHAHRHVPPVASPLGIAHTSHAPYSPPVFHTPQAVCRSHERCQCQQFLTPQQQQHHHHRLSLGYGSKPRRQLLASPVQQQQHHYHTPQQQQPQHSQALDHQSCHFSENVNYNASVGHTHSHNHAGIRHQPSSPLSAYGQPLPSSPQAGPLPPPPPPPSCLNQTGRRERFQLDFSPPCSHTPVAAMSRHHFQLAPTTLEYRVHPGGGGDTSSRQPVYSASTSSQVNSAPQLTSHHSQPPRLGDVHPHSIPAVPRPASILLPRPEVIIERLPHSVTKREVLSSSVDGSKSEAPSQADTSDNRDLMNEDPLGGLEKEPPGLTTKQPEPVSVVPKTENGIPLEKCPATATDTESEQTGDERKKSLRSSKRRPASTEGGAVKPSSPGRSRSSRTLRRRATPIVIDTTETESEAEIEPRRSSRKVYSLRSAQSEPASSVGQRVSRSRRGTDSEGTRTEEERVAANGQTDSDSEPSPRRRSQSAKSVRRLISDDEDDSASEVGGRGEVRRLQAEQQRVDSSPQLPAVVAVKGDPPTLEAGDVGEEDVSVDGTEDGGKLKGEGSRPVVLEGWYFRIVADGLVILEGTKENDKSGMKWHSGPVDRRQSARDLVTRSGTIYRLSGELNRELLSKVGGVDSKDIARRFRKGFPRDWAPLLQSYFEEQQEAELEKDDGAAAVDQGDVNTEKKVKVKSEQDRLKTPMLDCSLANSDFLSSLKRSSRGRTLKPSTYSSMSPFLNLSSDLYSYDMHGSFQGISSPVIDLTVEGNFVVKPRQSKKRVKREKEFVSEVEEEGRTTESEDSSSHKLRSDAKETREDWKENTTPDAVRKSSEEDSEWNQKAEALQTSSVISAKTRSRRTRRIIPSKLTKRVKKIVSDVKLDSTSYSSSASQTQEEVVTVKRTTTKKSVRITQRSEKQSSSRGGSRRRGRVAEGRSEDEETETEVQSNSESQERPRGRGRPRKGAGSRGVAFSRVLADGTESDNSSIERVQKRGRGRPRKWEQGVGRARESAAEERVQKRGRGRPRKWEQGVGRARECAAEDKDDPSSESNAPTEEWTLRDDPREAEEEEELQWTTEDFRDLKSIVHAVPAMTTNFWEVVARRLGTGHSARECSGQYLQITARDPKRRPKRAQERPRAAVTVAPPAITGKAGTMKRKRQLRSALEHMDRGYSDDIFDSTPFRKKMKHVELQELSDDECFHDDKKSEESKPIRTPSEAKRRLGAPTSHTPRLSDFLTTPDLKSGMRREAADNVIYKAQKAKKGPKKPLKKSAASLVPRGKRIVHEPLLRNIRTGEVTTIRMFEDSDDDSADSDPFSDIEDTYRDIITRLH